MKFKNILSLSLVFLMTFTATLSTSASIFADDVEIQTEESQSFTSSIFEDLLLKSEESNIENSNDNEISPMWLKKDHEKIIDFNVGDLSSHNIAVLKCTSDWADDCFPSSYSEDKINTYVTDISALHGAGNYVINLEFLWYFAIFLGRQSNPTSYDDMNNKIIAARNSAKEKIKGTTGYTTAQLQDLIKKSGSLVKYDGFIKQNDSLLTSADMKMRILGYSAHLIGDVYSHRTILQNTNRLTMSLFTSNLAADVAKGNVEYRFLGKLPSDGGYLINKDDKKHVNETCIDSPYYCPNRYDDAKYNVSLLVTEKSSEYDYYWFLCPWSDDVKLSNFKKYVKNSGLDTSELTASQWAKYST